MSTFLQRLLNTTAASVVCAAFIGSPARAQPSASPFTSATRYNELGLVTGTISADPDGAGPLLHRAVRSAYDADGRLLKVEHGTLSAWQDDTIAPANWAGFTIYRSVDTAFDAAGRKNRETVSSAGVAHMVTQFKFDSAGRLECRAVRMNPAVFNALPASACDAGSPGVGPADYGPDRITRWVYDAAGQQLQLRVGAGSAADAAEATWQYDLNGNVTTVIDGAGNRAALRYDGHGRRSRWVFPSASRPAAFNDATVSTALATSGAVNENDFEGFEYDPNGNRTAWRLRDGASILYSYDALDRATLKNLPGSEPDVTTSYDLLGRVTGSSQSGQVLTFTWDGFGRQLTQTGPTGTTMSAYDSEGRRTRLTWPGTAMTSSGQPLYVDYDYLATGEMLSVRERGATSGAGVLAYYGYDGLGRRTTVTRGNGTTSVYDYDQLGRANSLSHNLSGTTHDLTLGFEYNPAGQIAKITRSNDGYSHSPSNSDVSDTHNGLNQIVTNGAASVSYDARGNLASDGMTTYSYDSQNRLTGSVSSGMTSSYVFDPLGRLARIDASDSQFNTTLDYDGDAVIGEREPTGTRQTTWRAYVPGADSLPVAIYNYQSGAFQARFWYHEDERNSPVALSAEDGTTNTVNRYDEFGQPAATNWGRLQYTGQWFFSVPGIYHYRTRAYNPSLGRFLQPDPTGYSDGHNLYAYVGNDPINREDPDGRKCMPIFTFPWARTQYVCYIDENNAGLSGTQVRRLERQYTRAVNRLMARPGRSVSVTVGNQTMRTTAGQVAEGLINAHMRTERSGQGGFSNTNLMDTRGGELYYAPRIEMTIYSNLLNYDDTYLRRAFVHEGLHTVPEEAVFRIPYVFDSRGWIAAHTQPYRDAAAQLDR